jgi:hypothetical protein
MCEHVSLILQFALSIIGTYIEREWDSRTMAYGLLTANIKLHPMVGHEGYGA